MVTLYKLTTQDNKTRKGYHNECTWGPGITHSGTGNGGLCSPGLIHAYLSPALAALLNPIHANISEPRLWECSAAAIAATDSDLKVGVLALTTKIEIPLPRVSNDQRVIFAILCAKEAQKKSARHFEGNKSWQVTYRTKIGEFNQWADDFMSGKNRIATLAAYAARAAAYAAAYVADAYAARAAAYAAAYVADAAADAARAAAYAAAYVADAYAARAAAYAAAYVADAAADAARAAADAYAARAAADAYAARAAADAARAAAYDGVGTDFVGLAEQALRLS